MIDKLTDKVYFSSFLKSYKCWTMIERALSERGIAFELLEHTRDVWVRDFMPIQTDNRRFVGYDYSPDYLNDLPKFITRYDECMPFRPKELVQSGVRLDGGNFVACGDCALMTDKVLKENHVEDTLTFMRRLEELFQTEITLIPWDHSERFGHADGMVRYLGDGRVLINNYRDYDADFGTAVKEALKGLFEIQELRYGKLNQSENTWAYLNFLRVGDTLMVPELGYKSDKPAFRQLADAHPSCEIVPIPMRSIVKQGGGLNCISWNIKY